MQDPVVNLGVENAILFVDCLMRRSQALDERIHEEHRMRLSTTTRTVDYIDSLRRAYLKINYARDQSVC